jgi:hypothetical protein
MRVSRESAVLLEPGGERGTAGAHRIQVPERAALIGRSITGAALCKRPRGA